MVMFADMPEDLENKVSTSKINEMLQEAFKTDHVVGNRKAAEGYFALADKPEYITKKNSVIGWFPDRKGKVIMIQDKYLDEAKRYAELYEQSYGLKPEIRVLETPKWKDYLIRLVNPLH